jgi:hypothetical protein
METPANEYNIPELRAELAFRAEQPQKSGCFISLGERCVLSVLSRNYDRRDEHQNIFADMKHLCYPIISSSSHHSRRPEKQNHRRRLREE